METDNNSDKSEKESRIKKISEKTRKKILAISLVISTIVVLVLWFFSLKINLNSITPKPKDTRWEKIKNDLNNIFDKIGENINEAKDNLQKNQIATTTTEPEATTTLEISQDDLNLIKEKLQKIQTPEE